MIPYINLTSVTIGPLTLHVWGFFVALGALAGIITAARFGKTRGQATQLIYDLSIVVLVASMIGGRLGHVLFYDISPYLADPISILYIWQGGMSIFGGFIGAIIAGIIYLRKQHVDVFAYADTVIFGLPVGLWIGRIGCFLIHDHPGTATDFVLGVEYPDGITRHDHGLYLSLNGLLMAAVFLYLARKKRPIGTYIAIFAIWYGVIRFILDFFRLLDVKYLGLTPAQWLSIALIAFGLGVAHQVRLKANDSVTNR